MKGAWEHNTKRIDVRAPVGGQTLGLLGAEVCRRANHRTGARQLLGVIEGAGNAKVGDFHGAIICDHDVPGLYVPVDHAGLVGDREGGGRLSGDFGRSSR